MYTNTTRNRSKIHSVLSIHMERGFFCQVGMMPVGIDRNYFGCIKLLVLSARFAQDYELILYRFSSVCWPPLAVIIKAIGSEITKYMWTFMHVCVYINMICTSVHV